MDAERALADLMEISAQVEAAVLLDADGNVVSSTGTGADGLADGVRRLLEAGAGVREGSPLRQLAVLTRDGAVFAVREDERAIAATTRPDPTVGLVFYDLKTSLHALEQDDEGG